MALANITSPQKALRSSRVSLNAILGNGLSALQANQSALRVVSNNVANLNTDGYARRTVSMSAVSISGQLGGVQISDVSRVVDKYLQQEALSASSAASRYQTQSTVLSQINGLLGKPGDGTSLTSRLSDLFASFGAASLAPTQSANQQGVLNSLQSLASTISTLSSSLSTVQQQVDQQVSTSVGQVNTLLKQIASYNKLIQAEVAQGTSGSGIADQRDLAIKQLSQLVDIKVSEQANGQMVVSTADGLNLVSDNYAQLSYTAANGATAFNSIQYQEYNGQTGQAISSTVAFDQHLTGGSLKGLIETRDGTIGDLKQELGALAQKTALALNAQHNANTSFPPPAMLTGRNTGLMGTDALNFTGRTTVAIADANGNLVSRVDVDFDTGTYTIDGGSSGSIGSTVDSLVNAINTALGSNGTASFTDGKLSLAASGSNGVVVQDDASNPASRGGAGFSQFFGLNDLVQSDVPTLTSTGFKSTDDSGLAAGGTMSFTLKGPNGEVARTASVSVVAGMTMGDVVTALNTSFGGSMTFSLDASGALKATPANSYSNYSLNVTSDTTARGATDMTFTTLFGLGVQSTSGFASNFAVRDAIASAPDQLAFGIASLSGAVAGDAIVNHGDASGLLALQQIASNRETFSKVGALGAQVSTLGDYAGGLYQDVATRTQNADANATAQSDRQSEAEDRAAQTSGVNLDEELSNMMIYQQAYAAGARILQVVQQLYDTLLNIQ
ncbi:MAG: flagellar hook-associated protein FlgK [Alphaproteobacteria bacterium]|nr:flagellar hook-associated protein FlgK [Alphaproteobacteria bacterium]